MPDSTTLYALAAIITATGGAIVAVTGLIGELRRGRRVRDDSDLDGGGRQS